MCSNINSLNVLDPLIFAERLGFSVKYDIKTKRHRRNPSNVFVVHENELLNINFFLTHLLLFHG